MHQDLSDGFIRAAQAALPVLGPRALAQIGSDIAEGVSPDGILADFPLPEHADAAAVILEEVEDGALSWDAAGSYLIGLADGYEAAHGQQQVDLVWSGPATNRVPMRSTSQVVLDVIKGARRELLLMTYSAKPHRQLLGALRAAIGRGVKVEIVVETLAGAGSALQGADPALAFAELEGVALWHWPLDQRTDTGAKMHAKLIAADAKVLFTSSANLTASGIGRNIEAGLLVTGGTEPRRAAEHVRELQTRGVIARYF